MANVYLKDTTLISIGNAIREKTGETANIFLLKWLMLLLIFKVVEAVVVLV